MKALQESFCRVVLDPQFVDVGVSRQDRDWRIVLARPLRAAAWAIGRRRGKLNGSTPPAGKPASAVAAPTQPPLAWNATPGGAAGSAFAGDGQRQLRPPRPRRPHPRRPRRAGRYSGGLIGENIAAGQDGWTRWSTAGWRPARHCANLMNPGYRELARPTPPIRRVTRESTGRPCSVRP